MVLGLLVKRSAAQWVPGGQTREVQLDKQNDDNRTNALRQPGASGHSYAR